MASIFRIEDEAEQETSVKAGGFLLGLFFDREDGCDNFLRNVS
jgi:hypothetical protein